MPFTTLKIAVFAPTPMPIVSSVTTVKSGERSNLRETCRSWFLKDPTNENTYVRGRSSHFLSYAKQWRFEVHPLTGTSLSDKAYVLIRQKILKGEFQLGAPLSRRKLAAQFQMSFLPISEAMQRLESEGLVESRPRVGTRVRVPTAQDLRDRYIIREALESQAARLFCERATSAERKKLIADADRFERMLQVPARTRASAEVQFSVQTAHVALHTRIAEGSGC